MELLLLACLGAFFAAALTVPAGFGLSTMLTPIVLLLMGPHEAVAVVAVVHGAHNAGKYLALRESVDVSAFKHYGIWLVIGAIVGASRGQRSSWGLRVRIHGGSLWASGCPAGNVPYQTIDGQDGLRCNSERARAVRGRLADSSLPHFPFRRNRSTCTTHSVPRSCRLAWRSGGEAMVGVHEIGMDTQLRDRWSRCQWDLLSL